MSDFSVLHIITDLDTGGAERMLTQLLPYLAEKGVRQSVVCLKNEGALAEVIRLQGYDVTCLGMKPGKADCGSFSQLLKIIAKTRPDLIQSWLYHADLYGSLAAMLTGRKIVWGLHNNALSPEVKHSTRVVVRILSILSRFVPKRIISVSNAATSEHVRRGYRADRFVYIPNGFNTEIFKPDSGRRTYFREKLRINDDVVLYGNISRFDPQKNHMGLLDAWKKFSELHPEWDVRLLLAGKGLDTSNRELNIWLSRFQMTDRIYLLGERDDVPTVLNALDVFVLSSLSEAFPLALGEAMSTGLLCLSTDCGDAAEMLGENGIVVPRDDVAALARGMRKALIMPAAERNAMRVAVRQRAVKEYTLAQVADRYLQVYREVLGFPEEIKPEAAENSTA